MAGRGAGIRGLEFALPQPARWSLANGLTVLHLPISQASIVTTAVSYRVGAAAEEPEISGVAHFLEHMMFKGSGEYGPGEIDRRTQLLGGWNNAFTSHDSTVYLFGFASDRWQEALAIEADRMRGLNLDRREVDSERKVINEEISMYLDDPFDSLELEVQRELYGEHPYGRPILGRRETLACIDAPTLRRFHARHYGPENAVLVVAGDVARTSVEQEVEGRFGAIAERPGHTAMGSLGPPRLSQVVRIERRKGETARLLLALPAPAATDADHAHLVVAATVLGGGRGSFLYQRLVEELRLCSSVSADVTESVDAGVAVIAAEAMPEADPRVIEREVLEVLDQARDRAPEQSELERARSMLIADWVFGHERIHQQAILAATAETLFGADYPERHLEAVRDCSVHDLQRVTDRYLSPGDGSVVGWSLPAEGG